MRFKIFALCTPFLFALSACGGGGDVSGDVTTYSVLPSAFDHIATCPGGEVQNAVSVHTINGGKAPFRVRSQSGMDVGLVGVNNEFLDPSLSMINAEGDLVLTGKDPKFAVRSTLECGSDLSIIVLDHFSKTALVSIKVVGAKD